MSHRPQTHRRDFLLGRSVSAEVESRLQEATDNATPASKNASRGWSIDDPATKQAAYLEQYVKRAMACEFEWNFNLHQYPQAGQAAMEAFSMLDQLEQQMTVYRSDSEICQLNAAQVGTAIPVERQLFALLELAVELNRQTGGAFDMTSGVLSQAWGFDRRAGRLPAADQIQHALERVGSRHLTLNRKTSSVTRGLDGLAINLGGIGKGYALDRIGSLFSSFGIEDFLLHGGQSSLLAKGTSDTSRQVSEREPYSVDQETESNSEPRSEIAIRNPGWRIGISHPALPEVRLAEVVLRNQALGTSGTAKQGFYHRGKRYGHIVDPRTGWPASHFLSTTVIAPSAAEADALATAFFVMNESEIEQYCRQRPEIGVILIRSVAKSSSQVNLTTLNVSDLSVCQGHEQSPQNPPISGKLGEISD